MQFVFYCRWLLRAATPLRLRSAIAPVTIGLITGLLGSACQSPHLAEATAPAGSTRITFNDFEALAGWGGVTPGLALEQAHSGHYSLRAGAGQEFSHTFRVPLGQVLPAPPRRLQLRAWLYRTGPATDTGSALMLTISHPEGGGPDLLRLPLPAADQPANRWTLRQVTAALPAATTTDDRVSVFLWAPGLATPPCLNILKMSALSG